LDSDSDCAAHTKSHGLTSFQFAEYRIFCKLKKNRDQTTGLAVDIVVTIPWSRTVESFGRSTINCRGEF
jgi:hypothetical protein